MIGKQLQNYRTLPQDELLLKKFSDDEKNFFLREEKNFLISRELNLQASRSKSVAATSQFFQ